MNTEDRRPAGTRAPLLVLASGSPRRREILSEARIPFEVVVSRVDEQMREGEAPETLAERLAQEKCLEVSERLADAPARPVIGADTIVVVDGDVLGKPRDEAHACELLSRLVGRSHRVMTGVACAWTNRRGKPEPVRSQVVISHVEMRAASPAEIREYVAVGESLDKAGGYALQGEGKRFIVGVKGSPTNVIGLPIDETRALLRESGVPEEALRG